MAVDDSYTKSLLHMDSSPHADIKDFYIEVFLYLRLEDK
jgi:hypothetical protein